MNYGQAWTKKTISKDDWEKKLAAVKIYKEDMNKLVMNFLVTEASSTLWILANSCTTAVYTVCSPGLYVFRFGTEVTVTHHKA